ncbi:MAG: HAMP domain-containing histidine kinase [Bacteroidetes bacterium]|nr:HAMP domain-containing histidine kinase [Bacteroidota bacterium]
MKIQVLTLHRLVDQLLKGLQLLAMKRGNIVLNGISKDLMVSGDENLLAYVLWNLSMSAIESTKNECIHIGATVKAERTIIYLMGVGTYAYHTISHEYRKLQDAAEKLGGHICLEQDAVNGGSISFCLVNS